MVSHLQVSEQVCVRGESLRLLQSSLGAAASEDVIERVIIEVAERIGAIERALQLGDQAQLCKSARSLARIGDQMGLTSMAEVAKDAIICADRQDTTALYAVVQRLIRVGDASLTATIEGAVLSP